VVLYVLLGLLVEIAFGAAFPRLAYRLRGPARLSGRDIAVYVAGRTALAMVVTVLLHRRVLPWAKRMAEEEQRLRAQLTEHLGREPTDQEMLNYRLEQLRSATEAEGAADTRAGPR